MTQPHEVVGGAHRSRRYAEKLIARSKRTFGEYHRWRQLPQIFRDEPALLEAASSATLLPASLPHHAVPPPGGGGGGGGLARHHPHAAANANASRSRSSSSAKKDAAAVVAGVAMPLTTCGVPTSSPGGVPIGGGVSIASLMGLPAKVARGALDERERRLRGMAWRGAT